MTPTRSVRRTACAAVLCFGLLPLCACLRPDGNSDPALTPSDPAYGNTVQVRYLGVAGFFIRRGHDVVLTAPLYSNPDLLSEAGLPIYPHQHLIERLHFKKLNRAEDVAEVRAILVGHAHYDHLMDVPYVWRHSPNARVIGSVTMRNVLAAYTTGSGSDPNFPQPIPVMPATSLVALNDPADTYLDSRNCANEDPSPKAPAGARCPLFPGTPGKPYAPSPEVEIRGFCARHPDQLPGQHQGPGCQAQPLSALPTTTRADYLEGESIAYLIDFRDATTGRVRFRIYYHDVPSDGAFGKIPDDVLAQHEVDLALLCAGNWNLVEHQDADSIIRNLRPRHVLIGHWENFFKPQDQPPLEPAPLQPVGLFLSLIRERMGEIGGSSARRRVVLPQPQVLKTFPVV